MGENRTLQQDEVFTRNLMEISNALATAQQKFASGGGVAKQLQQAAVLGQQLILSNSRIEGTAVVGATNRIKIDAVPTQ